MTEEQIEALARQRRIIDLGHRNAGQHLSLSGGPSSWQIAHLEKLEAELPTDPVERAAAERLVKARQNELEEQAWQEALARFRKPRPA